MIHITELHNFQLMFAAQNFCQRLLVHYHYTALSSFYLNEVWNFTLKYNLLIFAAIHDLITCTCHIVANIELLYYINVRLSSH